MIPILQYVNPFEREPTAVLADSVAATENFAAHPRRVGFSRPLAYAQRRAFDNLREGPGRLLPQNIRDEINNLFLPLTRNTQQPAPPCKLQAPQTFQGETQQHPHVKPRP